MISQIIKILIPRVNIILINQLSVLISIPWLAYNLSIDSFGFIATSLIILQIFLMIMDWGFIHYSVELWNTPGEINYINENISSILFSQLLLMFLMIIIFSFLIFLNIINLPVQFFLCLLIPIFFGGIFPLWFFNINNHSNKLVAITLASRIFFLLFIYIFVNSDSDALFFIIIQGFTFGVITIYSFILMINEYNFKLCKFDRFLVLKHIKNSLPFFFNSITNNHINSLWGLVLSFSGNLVAIANFTLADHAYKAGSVFTNTSSQVIRVNSIDKEISIVSNTLKFIIFIFFVITIIGILLAEPFINYFFSSEYYESIFVIKLIAILWFIQAIIKLIGYPLIGKLYGVNKVNLIGNNFLFIHIFNMIIWLTFFKDLITLMVLFISASLFHLIFLISFFYFNKLKNISDR